MKRYIMSLLVAALTVSEMSAQGVTYNHDDSKYNQIGIMEIGTGGFTPALYYDIFHNSYQNSARTTNKLTYRSLASVSSYNQVKPSEQIDSALTKRAKVEALNIADREIDIAWLAESKKVESCLAKFQKNIDRITYVGGTSEDKERWQDYYKMYTFAISETKDAYMPNSQRKQMYINISDDCTKQNQLLIKYIVQLKKQKDMEERASSHTDRRSNDNNAHAAQTAYSRWRESGWSGSGTSGQSGNGGGMQAE